MVDFCKEDLQTCYRLYIKLIENLSHSGKLHMGLIPYISLYH